MLKEKNCDAEICLIFPCDEENDFDQMFTCINNCTIHLRCEGIILLNSDQSLSDEYKCVKCRSKVSNRDWIENELMENNKNLTVLQNNTTIKLTTITANIDSLEQNENEMSGPRQNILKESMKVLGDIARFHGGELQGKQVQKLLDDARNETFNILECINDCKDIKDKFVRAFTTLANISDILKLPVETFNDEEVSMIKKVCEDWGRQWPVDFPKRNLTPKGHILIFTVPKIIEEKRMFYRYYKVEEKGEAIHAEFNDIERKVWAIKNTEDRMWKFIEKYELRNMSNVNIVKPIQRK